MVLHLGPSRQTLKEVLVQQILVSDSSRTECKVVMTVETGHIEWGALMVERGHGEGTRSREE